MRVQKLSILLLKSYIGPFIITFLVAMFIFEMQFIWVYLDDLMGKGLSTWVILKLLFFASARVVNMALPLAILMSSIMTMGSMAENNELTAVKSAGVSLLRIMRPLIVFSVFLSLMAFVFANNLWPVANLKCRTMLFSIMKQKPAFNLTDGVFYNGIEGISIRAGKNNPETGELRDVLIYDHRGGERANRTVIRADSGLMAQTEDKRYLVLTLYNGHTYDEQKDKDPRKPQQAHLHADFKQTILRLDLSSLAFEAEDEEIMKNPAEMMSIGQLDYALDSLHARTDTIALQYQEGTTRWAVNRLREDPLALSPIPVHGMLWDELNDAEQRKAVFLALDNSKKARDLIQRQEEELRGRNKSINRHKIEWHRKFFLAVVCLVLFFIGAPLGAIIRKGGLGMPTLIALGLFIVYQLLTMIGERMAKKEIIEPWVGMWFSTVVLLPLSLWITFKATREAALMDKEAYSKWWMKLKSIMPFRKRPTI
ncbi:MAG: LptF/LptG family permease [Flavobacteriales bacterium]